MKWIGIPAAAMLAVCLTLLPAHAGNSWQSAYLKVLDEYRASENYLPETGGEVSYGARWDLCDVNGDEIPELFISPDTSHAFGCLAYSFIDGEAVLLETREGQRFGEYGLTKVCPEAHLIRGYHFGMGTEMIGYYEFDGIGLVEKDHFIGTSVYISEELGTEDTYQRGGVEISEEEYMAAVDAYESLNWVESVGRAYSFDDMSPLAGGQIQPAEPIPLADIADERPNMRIAFVIGLLGAAALGVAAAAVSILMRRNAEPIEEQK